MKTFKQFIKEHDDTTLAVDVRAVTPHELELIKDSKRLSEIIHAALQIKKLNIDEIKKLHDDLTQFNEFKFLNKTIKELDTLLNDHGKMMSAPEHIKQNMDQIKHHTNELKKAFLSTDFKKGKVHRNELNAIITPADRHVDAPGQARQHIKNAFTHETSIFGSTLLLHTLGDDEYETIAAIDTNKPLYTAVDFPLKRLETDWHYIVYFLINLTKEDQPKAIDSASDFRTHIKVSLADNPKFERLLKITDHYLHSNDKTLIPEMTELINAIPIIKAANDKRKKSIKIVYRGLGFGEDEYVTHQQIEKEEKRARFVATSDSSHAARNFALQKGHLDSERRSGIGYVIKYAVTPTAILFDTKIIDTVFNESEIVIDTTKAKIIDIDQV